MKRPYNPEEINHVVLMVNPLGHLKDFVHHKILRGDDFERAKDRWQAQIFEFIQEERMRTEKNHVILFCKPGMEALRHSKLPGKAQRQFEELEKYLIRLGKDNFGERFQIIDPLVLSHPEEVPPEMAAVITKRKQAFSGQFTKGPLKNRSFSPNTKITVRGDVNEYFLSRAGREVTEMVNHAKRVKYTLNPIEEEEKKVAAGLLAAMKLRHERTTGEFRRESLGLPPKPKEPLRPKGKSRPR
ncbi:MAG: hypothetical protein HY917_02810 [Candidatus Diapherotrites archaeon]|nr:hypothetical protein [Candidatus Diapherotrites archaeon]